MLFNYSIIKYKNNILFPLRMENNDTNYSYMVIKREITFILINVHKYTAILYQLLML